ncbi:MAG: FHA domain-containing protein [Proteobacteria bacterium]|nr:FHA domain-containing protein [Pseudomonadota bacterium]
MLVQGGLDEGNMISLFDGVTSIGRSLLNDIVVDELPVSRQHAAIQIDADGFWISDLDSRNGTFVNGEPITGDVWLDTEDQVRIGPYRFVVGEDRLAQFDESGDLRVDAIGLNKWVRKDLNILQNISLVFNPREFIVVVGQSGGGKSTLVDAIAERNARRIAMLATMIPERLGAMDTREFDVETEALPLIWDNLDEIANKAQNLVEAANTFADIAAGGDQQATLGGLRSLGGACGSCHDTFRVDDD